MSDTKNCTQKRFACKNLQNPHLQGSPPGSWELCGRRNFSCRCSRVVSFAMHFWKLHALFTRFGLRIRSDAGWERPTRCVSPGLSKKHMHASRCLKGLDDLGPAVHIHHYAPTKLHADVFRATLSTNTWVRCVMFKSVTSSPHLKKLHLFGLDVIPHTDS